MSSRFSWFRWWAIVCKEFIQLRRDRITFAMIIGIPLVQMTLFGGAINFNPKHLPTAILAQDHGPFMRRFKAAMQNSGYFKIVATLETESQVREELREGRVLFVLEVPANFTRELIKGNRPSLRLDADATDPVAVAGAIATLPGLVTSVLNQVMVGPLSAVAPEADGAFDVQVHKLYNPESITQYSVVPGLMGVVLTMTMVMMTGLAVTRERERGTMENLLAMPTLPLEVITGKIVPYIAIGLIQVSLILGAAHFAFQVPIFGNVVLLYLSSLVFIAASLSVGIMLSSLARNQLQGMQLSFFYFLPNILLSGFVVPFDGMPGWARTIGNLLPLTYFNRITRGVLLKGAGWGEIWPHIWPMGLFMIAVTGIAMVAYRRTLD